MFCFLHHIPTPDFGLYNVISPVQVCVTPDFGLYSVISPVQVCVTPDFGLYNVISPVQVCVHGRAVVVGTVDVRAAW